MIFNFKKSFLKTFSIVLFSSFFTQKYHAQFYIEAFGGVANYRGLDNINKALYKYNVTRDWLTERMEGINRTNFKGWEVVLGDPEYFMEFGFTAFSKSTTASGPQPSFFNIVGRRDVKIGSYGLFYGFIWKAWEQDNDKLELVLGLAPSLEVCKSKTRYTEDIDNPSVFEEMQAFDVTIGGRLSASLKYFPIDWLGFVIKPTYYLTGKMLVNDTHNNILSIKGTYPADLADRFSRFSISLGLCISFSR